MGSSAPIVSIVINNYNYGRYLPRSIGSALAQTYRATEVVVVDDGSTDGSRDVMARYAASVTTVLRRTNGGQGAALNEGFRAARGSVVIFLDADDYLYPDAAARVAQTCSPEVAVVQYRLHLVDERERVLDVYPPPERAFESGDVKERLLRTGRFVGTVTSGNAFSRAVLERILPIPQSDFRIAADGYLITVAPLFGKVASIEEPLGAYRLHDSNSWARAPTDRLELAEHLRRTLKLDLEKYRVLRERAARLGLKTEPRPGLQDEAHLEARIASLVLDPARHPGASDARWRLAARGVRAAREARLPWRRRLSLGAWFACVGVLPRAVAAGLASWRFAPALHPEPVDRIRALR